MLRWGCWWCTIQRSDPDQKHHSCAFFSAMHFVTWESGSCWLKTGSGIEWKHWLGRAEKTLVCFGCFNLNLSPCLRGPDIVLPDICVVTVVTRLNLSSRNNFVLSWYQREFVFIRFVRLQNLEAALRCATPSKPPRWRARIRWPLPPPAVLPSWLIWATFDHFLHLIPRVGTGCPTTEH